MPGFELHALIIGAVLFAAALGIALGMRHRSRRQTRPALEGLLIPEPTLETPSGQTPGMVGALRNAQVDARDLRLTLVDLAARGYLRVTPLLDDNGTCYDWVIRRTGVPVDASLHDFEEVLLTLPFTSSSTDRPPRSLITLSGLTSLPSRPMHRAQTLLIDHLRRAGWLDEETHHRHSPWGWIGSLMLVAGLLTTVAMLINLLATTDFRGILGGLLMVGAGILLVSLGRRQDGLTDAGALARAHSQALREALDDLEAEDLPPDQVAGLFNRLLPWALAFDSQSALARTVDDLLRRSSRWGRPVDLELAWFQADQDHRPTTAHEFAARVATMIDHSSPAAESRRRLVNR